MSRTPEHVCFGCVPIVDNERTNAYVRWARNNGMFNAGCCEQVDLAFCPDDSPDTPYVSPADDNACWFDVDHPESAEFLGLWVTDLDGMDNDTYIRGTSDAGGNGFLFTRATTPGKTLTFSVMLFAASQDGMAYGYNWLVNILRDQGCAHGDGLRSHACGTSELRIRELCPSPGSSDLGLRVFPSAALTSGVVRADGSRRDHCCNNYRQYTFVIQTGTPESYADPACSCFVQVDDTLDNAHCRDWNGCGPQPVEPDGCADPTGCGDLFVDAFESPSLRDNCYCAPWSQTRTACCIDEFQTGSVSQAIIIDLFAGQDIANERFNRLGTRNLELLIFENPMRLPCPVTQDDYANFIQAVPYCARVTVGYMAAGSIVRIDGRTGEAFQVCRGKNIPIYDSIEGDLKKLKTGCNPLVVIGIWDSNNVVTLGNPDPLVVATAMQVRTAREFS